jgi:hypothetical protein
MHSWATLTKSNIVPRGYCPSDSAKVPSECLTRSGNNTHPPLDMTAELTTETPAAPYACLMTSDLYSSNTPVSKQNGAGVR